MLDGCVFIVASKHRLTYKVSALLKISLRTSLSFGSKAKMGSFLHPSLVVIFCSVSSGEVQFSILAK